MLKIVVQLILSETEEMSGQFSYSASAILIGTGPIEHMDLLFLRHLSLSETYLLLCVLIF